MAENLFGKLIEIKDADELRRRLAFGNNPSELPLNPEDDRHRQETNDDLALIILADAISCAREGRSNEEGLALVDWLHLVAQYGTQSNLFQAHSRLLQGLFYQNNKNDHDAKTSFKESLQNFEYLTDDRARGSASVCACCLGMISTDTDEFGEAESFFQRASELAKTDTTATPGWTDYIEREIEITKEQQLAVDKLAKASLEDDVTSLLEENNRIVSDRTIKILQSRAFRAVARDEVKDAIAVATVADQVAKSLGKEPDVRLRLADIALYLNEYATAEAIFQALLTESPDNPAVQQGLARSFMQQGKYNEARAILENAVERSPRDAASLRDLGLTYINLKEPDLAQR